MDLTAFLTAVVPAGTIVVAKKVERTKFSHKVCKLHSAAADTIVELAADSDVYFALAAFKQGFHTNPAGKKVLRVRTNVDSLKALWLDLDVGPGKGYANVLEAMKGVQAFCNSVCMPKPAIAVHSGNGIHVYWPLTEAIPLARWQVLADALKAATLEKGLHADPVATADSCRVLRPPGTSNFKDPTNPKPVRLILGSPSLYTTEELEGALAPWVGRFTRSAGPDANDDLTGGMGIKEAIPSAFEQVIKHCGVLKATAESHGRDSSEPEWVATLQLLKHCTDGSLWVHAVSDRHPGYTEEATDRKWQQRLQNNAGPTLCATFEQYAPDVCAKCPHKGFVKSPIQLGQAGVQEVLGLPYGYRVCQNNRGIERMMKDTSTTPPTLQWVRVLRHVPQNLRAIKSIVTDLYDLSLDITLGNSKTWSLTFPGGTLGDRRKLAVTLAQYGVVLKDKEAEAFGTLMATWLEQLQHARRVVDVTEQLGWMVSDEKIVGFSCGQSTFYSDGRIRNDVRAAKEFAAVSKFYEPKGTLDEWKGVAAFLAEQDNPAFTATVAAGFAAPLLKFTGHSGGIMAIVSIESGVGKSSALKCSQAIWGSPVHGMNAVDDTPKSVARKVGFLNNLPAYWDELRGRRTIDEFLTLAFQITQGKEKTRLDSSATLREIRSWETMMIVASNESIFDAMGKHSASDAGLVRTFEIVVDPFRTNQNKAEISLIFERLHANYGQAGRLYAQYLATHAQEVDRRVREVFLNVSRVTKAESHERFWIAMIASLLVGAELSNKLDLMKINMSTLGNFLLNNLSRLRSRSMEKMEMWDASELLASYMQANQGRMLWVDKFPNKRTNGTTYMPQVVAPKEGKVSYVVAGDEQLARIPVSGITRWCDERGVSYQRFLKHAQEDFDAKVVRVRLGLGTMYELTQQRCLEVDLNKVSAVPPLPVAEMLKQDGSSDPACSSDSPSATAP